MATHRRYHNELKEISTVRTPKLPSWKPKLGQLWWFSLAASAAWAHACVCRPALHQARDSAWTSSRPGGQHTACDSCWPQASTTGPQEQQGEPHGLSSAPQLLLGGLGTHKDGVTARTRIGGRCSSRICWEQIRWEQKAAVSFLAKQSRELSSNWMR